jgi:L-lactate dehydrogenase complex protein LldE
MTRVPDSVFFYGTCLIDLFYPEAGLSAMRLLRRTGVRVLYPQGQTCCAQPAYNSGYREEARKVARLQLDALAGEPPVVVPSASCAGMLKVHYPRLFAGTPDFARAEQLAGRVVELTDFLARVLDIELDDLGPQIKVVLHSSCSSRREMGVADAAVDLLARLDGVESVEPANATECCGFGGTFAVKQADVSGAMVRDKTDALRATGAARVISQDCGCLMNIGGAFAHQGNGPEAQHIAEFLWERTS